MLTSVDAAAAEDALLRAIHGIDEVDAETRAAPLSAHIAAATPADEASKLVETRVLPTAILLATGRFDVAGARASLRRHRGVRDAVRAAEAGAEQAR